MSRSSPRFFPPPEAARHDGLLFLGGRLDPAWLLDAYTHGIFPWPVMGRRWPGGRPIRGPSSSSIGFMFRDGWPALPQRQVRGHLRSGLCRRGGRLRHGPDRRHATWITRPLNGAYVQLHELGYAHSVEVWHEGRLAGGTYGVAIGGLFAAESMFHYVTDASKVALVSLVRHLRRAVTSWSISSSSRRTRPAWGRGDSAAANICARLSADLHLRHDVWPSAPAGED